MLHPLKELRYLRAKREQQAIGGGEAFFKNFSATSCDRVGYRRLQVLGNNRQLADDSQVTYAGTPAVHCLNERLFVPSDPLQVCVLAGGGTQLCLSCLPVTQEAIGSPH